MQTFLPYSSFAESAAVLDRQRLGKQRVETLQIMRALLEGRGWVHHPATKMWAGYEHALLAYQEAVCAEWVGRGYSDTCLEKTMALYLAHRKGSPWVDPPWLGNPDFHISHQSNLVRKNREYYGPLFPSVPGYLPYVWPLSRGVHVSDEPGLVTIENAHIIYRNFEGRETTFNRAGDRNFTVVLPPQLGIAMGEDGWNVKVKQPRDEGGPVEYHVEVAVGYGYKPPRVVMVTGENGEHQTPLTEDLVGMLDSADAKLIDLVLRPYEWSVNGNTGVKAYLKTLYITLDEDDIERKYSNR